MRKTFKYRLYPTKKQHKLLCQQVGACRWLYNHFLEQRKATWEKEKKSVGIYKQMATIPDLKKEFPWLKNVYSQSLQNVATRIDLAFQAFFRRCKISKKPGYPRFQGRSRYNSMTFPQLSSGGCRLKDGKLKVSKVGRVKIVLHRPLEGTLKTATITKTPTGKWFICFSCECKKPTPLPKNKKTTGIDVGLHTFAFLSTGQKIDNPRFAKIEEKALAKTQRRLAKAAKGTPERAKRRKVVARVYERITNKRRNFTHQWSRKLVDQFGTIIVEDLNVNRMVHDNCLARSIMDAAWSGFFEQLNVKAEWAGRTFIAVNPAYTSQDCSKCGHRQKMPLSTRTFECPCCGLVIDRDHNASLNILRLGQQSLLSRARSPSL